MRCDCGHVRVRTVRIFIRALVLVLRYIASLQSSDDDRLKKLKEIKKRAEEREERMEERVQEREERMGHQRYVQLYLREHTRQARSTR
jgi:hypothetical protein